MDAGPEVEIKIDFLVGWVSFLDPPSFDLKQWWVQEPTHNNLIKAVQIQIYKVVR